MKADSDIRKNRNCMRLAYKLIRRAIDCHPERSNISAIARAIKATGAKLSFCVNGYSIWRADEFLDTMTALGEVKFNKDQTVSMRLKLSEYEYNRLKEISKGDYTPTRTSALCGDFSRDTDREVHG